MILCLHGRAAAWYGCYSMAIARVRAHLHSSMHALRLLHRSLQLSTAVHAAALSGFP
jgi:hypothetical protein